jgi:hypothetical protein
MGEEMVRLFRAGAPRVVPPRSDLVRVLSLAVRGEGPVKRDSANLQAQTRMQCFDAEGAIRIHTQRVCAQPTAVTLACSSYFVAGGL